MNHSTKIMVLLLAILLLEAGARPNNSEEYGSNPDKCRENDDKAVIVCQLCAKQTKSPVVYPMCCKDEDDVFQWCSRFINFGMHPPSSHTS